MANLNREWKSRIDSLDDAGKLRVANYILEKLDTPDPLIDRAWLKESSSRLKAMRSGRMKVFAYKDVMAAHLKKS